jgi:hypothetical protein
VKRLGWFVSLLFSLCGWAGAASAFPVTLTLVPTALVLNPGQSVSVAVVVGGLVGVEEQEVALESFDLDLSFGTSRLSYGSLTFGSSLGTAAQSFRNGPGTPNTTGVVVMEEFSFLSEASLLALQSAPFTLASIQFTALNNPGNVVLQLINLASSSLGGVGGQALGNQLQAPSSLTLSIVAVPEPGLAALLLAAAAVARARRRSA